MPESRRRKPKKKAAAGSSAPVRVSAKRKPSAPWVGGLILGLFLFGVAYLLVYYFSGGGFPGMSALGGWNIFIGFAFVVSGLAVATQWK